MGDFENRTNTTHSFSMMSGDQSLDFTTSGDELTITACNRPAWGDNLTVLKLQTSDLSGIIDGLTTLEKSQ